MIFIIRKNTQDLKNKIIQIGWYNLIGSRYDCIMCMDLKGRKLALDFDPLEIPNIVIDYVDCETDEVEFLYKIKEDYERA